MPVNNKDEPDNLTERSKNSLSFDGNIVKFSLDAKTAMMKQLIRTGTMRENENEESRLQEFLEERRRRVSMYAKESLCINEDKAWIFRVVDPNSRFSFVWELVLFFSLIYTMLLVPMEMLYQVREKETMDATPLTYTYQAFFAVDSLFFVDILLSFRTGFQDNFGSVTMEPEKIMRKYLMQNFWPDIISFLCIPSFSAFSSSSKLVRSYWAFWRMLRFFRLYRIVELNRSTRKWIPFARQLLWFLLSWYLLSCLWAVPAHHSDSQVWNWNSHLEPPSALSFFVLLVYKTFIAFLGDDTLVQGPYIEWRLTSEDVAYGLFLNISGIYIVYSNFVRLVLLLENIGKMRRDAEEDDALQVKVMREMKLSAELRKRVRDYRRFKASQTRQRDSVAQDHDKFLSGLSDTLRKKVMFELHNDTIRAVPIFADCNEKFISRVCMNLFPKFYQPHDFVIEAGDEANEMFFINQGEVCILDVSQGHEKYFVLKRGSFFGEGGILLNTRRKASAQCMTHVCLYILLKSDLLEILEDFQAYAQRMQQVAYGRVLAASPTHENCQDSSNERRSNVSSLDGKEVLMMENGVEGDGSRKSNELCANATGAKLSRMTSRKVTLKSINVDELEYATSEEEEEQENGEYDYIPEVKAEDMEEEMKRDGDSMKIPSNENLKHEWATELGAVEMSTFGNEDSFRSQEKKMTNKISGDSSLRSDSGPISPVGRHFSPISSQLSPPFTPGRKGSLPLISSLYRPTTPNRYPKNSALKSVYSPSRFSKEFALQSPDKRKKSVPSFQPIPISNRQMDAELTLLKDCASGWKEASTFMNEIRSSVHGQKAKEDLVEKLNSTFNASMVPLFSAQYNAAFLPFLLLLCGEPFHNEAAIEIMKSVTASIAKDST